MVPAPRGKWAFLVCDIEAYPEAVTYWERAADDKVIAKTQGTLLFMIWSNPAKFAARSNWVVCSCWPKDKFRWRYSEDDIFGRREVHLERDAEGGQQIQIQYDDEHHYNEQGGFRAVQVRGEQLARNNERNCYRLWWGYNQEFSTGVLWRPRGLAVHRAHPRTRGWRGVQIPGHPQTFLWKFPRRGGPKQFQIPPVWWRHGHVWTQTWAHWVWRPLPTTTGVP